VSRAKGDGDDGVWEFLGILTFLDPPRPDTKHTIDCAAGAYTRSYFSST
jgi:H+-transporting ATPase